VAGRFELRTPAREALVDITSEVSSLLEQLGAGDGVLHLWSLHTTCALTVNEGADPDVARDLVEALKRIAPRAGDYRHAEGNSDSHVKTSLCGPGLTLLVEGGRPVLGTWQRVFLAEFDGPRQRTVAGVFVPAPD
jgi:secondary thiamine-phosphate synthase enzyme